MENDGEYKFKDAGQYRENRKENENRYVGEVGSLSSMLNENFEKHDNEKEPKGK